MEAKEIWRLGRTFTQVQQRIIQGITWNHCGNLLLLDLCRCKPGRELGKQEVSIRDPYICQQHIGKFYRKIQNTVELSSFGLEFVALRIASEMAEALKYKLRKFGINLEGPTEVYCENK